MKLATSFIASIAIAASTFAANADTYDFAYAESIAQQAPAIEACIADTLENLTPYFARVLGGQTAGEISAEAWMGATTRGTNKELLEAAAEAGLYRAVLAGEITAAAATQAHADIIACVTY